MNPYAVRQAPIRLLLLLFATSVVALAGCQSTGSVNLTTPQERVVPLESLAMAVDAAENRAVSFTNKRSAFYYTQTHRNDHPEHAYFRGFNIAGRRVFSDYRLKVDGAYLDPQLATAVVRPDALIRTYPQGITETLRIFDQQDVVEVQVTGTATDIALELSGDTVTAAGTASGLDWYVSRQDASATLQDSIAVGRRGDRFLIAVGPTRESARALFEQAATKVTDWESTRRARLVDVVSDDHYLWMDDPQLTAALRWIQLTTDSLVTRQRGDGIYAGLPWFNEYWGRDSFISLPGATLVTGHFEEARAILVSFAQFQDLDRTSRFYGRLPNIVKPGSIDYHTTDGTPRWVIALRDYVRYSGDRSLVTELYPNVTASIEGALANWTDASGYLFHADNETWMDARREPDKASYSPRSTRANDIQALWYEQLRAGAEFARANNDTAAAARWGAAAERLRGKFARDFVQPGTARIADRLDAHDVPDFQVRPNALFALQMIDEDAVAAGAAREAWEALVYPWGVATLDQRDPDFHPYHLAPEHYHKDAAYHNGTVWPWLNGIAMQRMIELGQIELAWTLFQNTSAIALQRGVVGGLPENLDAYPHPGDALPRLTGTFLQGWSNAEHLRIWYQGFLGIQPGMERGELRLAPRLPKSFVVADFTARIGIGVLHARYDHADGTRRYTWRIEGQAANVSVDIAPFAVGSFSVEPGDTLLAVQRQQGLQVRRIAGSGVELESVLLEPDRERLQRQQRLDAILAGTAFAQPGIADAHPVMQQVRKP